MPCAICSGQYRTGSYVNGRRAPSRSSPCDPKEALVTHRATAVPPTATHTPTATAVPPTITNTPTATTVPPTSTVTPPCPSYSERHDIVLVIDISELMDGSKLEGAQKAAI